MTLDEPIARLFFANGDTDASARILEGEWWKPEVKARYGHQLSGVFWPSSRKAAIEALQKLLHVPLADVLVGGWKKYGEIMQYADTARFPPERRAEVSLWDHTIRSTHKPALDVRLDGTTVATLQLEVVLSLALTSGVLSIQNARIQAIRLGDLEAKGEIKLFDGAIVREFAAKKIAVPGAYEPPGGIPLRTA